jgi:hypothetical protein
VNREYLTSNLSVIIGTIMVMCLSSKGHCDGMEEVSPSDDYSVVTVSVPTVFEEGSIKSLRVAFYVSTDIGSDDLICIPLPKPNPKTNDPKPEGDD